MINRVVFLKTKVVLSVLLLFFSPFFYAQDIAEASDVFPLTARLVSPSRGIFLVADPKVSDPTFKKTVVLILEHGKKGTMGLIINRPTNLSLSQLLPKIDAAQPPVGSLYDGGPVDRKTLTLLYRSASPPDGVRPLFSDVYASQEARVLADQLRFSGAKQSFRLYAGYAGWGAEQLLREMKRGDWHLVKADTASLYERPVQGIWQEMFMRSQSLSVKSEFLKAVISSG